jgi:NAD(P)-dependent dehydrogenase (short-subunit alcohol dehydrogenase family)
MVARADDREISCKCLEQILILQSSTTHGASIILNASITSIKGTPAFSVYSATKAAVRSFARNWTLDLKERHIRVNAISPGMVPTPGYNLMGLSDEQVQEFIDSQANNIPLGRVGTPDGLPKPLSFSLQMTAALSTVLSCLLMAVWHRFEAPLQAIARV